MAKYADRRLLNFYFYSFLAAGLCAVGSSLPSTARGEEIGAETQVSDGTASEVKPVELQAGFTSLTPMTAQSNYDVVESSPRCFGVGARCIGGSKRGELELTFLVPCDSKLLPIRYYKFTLDNNIVIFYSAFASSMKRLPGQIVCQSFEAVKVAIPLEVLPSDYRVSIKSLDLQSKP